MCEGVGAASPLHLPKRKQTRCSTVFIPKPDSRSDRDGNFYGTTRDGGSNNEGSIFSPYHCAPRQKSLILVDVVYPSWMQYKNLRLVEDVPGYIQAQRDVLLYDFDNSRASCSATR